MSHWSRLLALILALNAITPSGLLAGFGRTVTLPSSRVIPRSGLTIRLAFEGIGTNGLRPVRVTIQPIAGAFPTDRDIRIDVGIGNYRQIDFVASKVFHATEGALVHHDYIYLPIRSHANRVTIETYEGGRRLRDLCLENTDVRISDETQHTQPPAILIVDFDSPLKNKRKENTSTSDGKLPDLRRVHDEFRQRLFVQRSDSKPTAHDYDEELSNKQIQQFLTGTSYIDLLHPADLTEDWISLSGVDIVILSWVDIQRLRAEFPARWQALRAWAFVGGNLVVYGAGTDFSELASIDQHFGLVPIDPEATYLGWNRRSKLDRQLDVRQFTGQPDDDSVPTQIEKANFVTRDIGLGLIAAMNADDPFPGSSSQWATLMKQLQASWEQRHGMSLSNKNEGFWRFILEGLGLAPVNLFRVWILVFVLAIGPVNYFLLRRTNRLSWMLMTVPAGALLATLGLLVYALITDGIGARYRVRSITHIDQRAGLAATWARQVYYAGIAPSGGLTFPTDAVVHPIVQSPNYEFPASQRQVNWQDRQQRLTGGHMQSRVMSQFMVLRSRESPLGIDVHNQADRVSITNRLGARIRDIYLVAEDGRRYGGVDLATAAGESVELMEQTDPVAIHRRLLELIEEHPLALPEGFDMASLNDIEQMNGTYYYGYYGNNAIISTRTSILEKHLSIITGTSKGSTVRNKAFVRPRTYVAVVDGCAEVPIGVDGTEQDSLYLITGAW